MRESKQGAPRHANDQYSTHRNKQSGESLTMMRPELKHTAFHSRSGTQTMLITGDVQFDHLVICMSVLGKKMASWANGNADDASFELGYARASITAMTSSGQHSHALALQLFEKGRTDLEHPDHASTSGIQKWKLTMSVAEIRSWGEIFSKLGETELKPAFLSASEQWFSPSLLGMRNF